MTTTSQLSEPDHNIVQPGKLIRIASMAQAMLTEARATPCDQAGCERFRVIYERTLAELNAVLPNDLKVELANLALTFNSPSPSPSELRIAQAELVGWLEGVFNGIAASAAAKETIVEEQVMALIEMPGQYL